jgi:hypothetical protein
MSVSTTNPKTLSILNTLNQIIHYTTTYIFSHHKDDQIDGSDAVLQIAYKLRFLLLDNSEFTITEKLVGHLSAIHTHVTKLYRNVCLKRFTNCNVVNNVAQLNDIVDCTVLSDELMPLNAKAHLTLSGSMFTRSMTSNAITKLIIFVTEKLRLLPAGDEVDEGIFLLVVIKKLQYLCQDTSDFKTTQKFLDSLDHIKKSVNQLYTDLKCSQFNGSHVVGLVKQLSSDTDDYVISADLKLLEATAQHDVFNMMGVIYAEKRAIAHKKYQEQVTASRIARNVLKACYVACESDSDADIAERDAAIAERDATIAAFAKTVAERDATIIEHNATIAALAKITVDDYATAITSGKQIAALNSELSAVKSQLAKFRELLA